LTVNVWPPTDTEALRACPVVFGATWNTTTPLPIPEAPLTRVSQFALLPALHAQALVVFTVKFPVPPVALNDRSDPERENVHGCCEPVVAPETETQGGADPPPMRTHGATST